MSSPKIGPDGTIYFGSRVTDNDLVNIRMEQVWQFKTLDGDANSKIYSTPALAKDGTIYFGSRASDLEFMQWMSWETSVGCPETCEIYSFQHFHQMNPRSWF